jgi:hypothetical protein
MKVKDIHGDGLLSGLKKVGKQLKQPAKDIGKEVLKELVPIAKETAKEAIKQKMSGSKKENEGGFLVTAGTIGATLLANELMKNQGNGIYTAGVRLSPQQSRNLRMGKGVTLKKEMIDEAGRFLMGLGEAEAKKVMKALSKNKGVKITRDMLKEVIDKKSGKGIFGKIAAVAAPIIAERVIDAGAKAIEKKIDGSGIYSSGVRSGRGIFAAGSGMGNALPIQLGTPYMLANSPGNKPFIDTGILTGSKNSTRVSKQGSGVCM